MSILWLTVLLQALSGPSLGRQVVEAGSQVLHKVQPREQV
jgi:hypothetical protein